MNIYLIKGGMSLAFSLMIGSFIYAQHLGEIRIGQAVPSVNILNVSNYTSKKVNLSNLRGKLVILDFWFTRCVGCIQGFTKMEALQRQFGDKVQVFIVNRQTQEEIDKEYSSMNKKLVDILKSTTLPSITGDTILSKLFPHTIVPHEIWIGTDGLVKAITNDKNVNGNNIEELLASNRIDLPVKRDFLSHAPLEALLPQIYQLYHGNMKYYTTLMTAIPGLRGPATAIELDSANGRVRITRLNSRIVDLYFYAFQRGRFQYAANPYLAPETGFGKNILLQVSDSSRYLYSPGSQGPEDWGRKNMYCYESVMPLIKNNREYELNRMYDKMISDLNNYFQIKGRMEIRRTECYVLKTSSGSSAILTRGGGNLVEEKGGALNIRNMPLKILLRFIGPILSLPLIDESGITGNIDIEIPDFKDERSIEAALLRKGLKLDREAREVNTLVLTEAGS